VAAAAVVAGGAAAEPRVIGVGVEAVGFGALINTPSLGLGKSCSTPELKQALPTVERLTSRAFAR
jgi:hypothetical protein